jgi:hypothetical protein
VIHFFWDRILCTYRNTTRGEETRELRIGVDSPAVGRLMQRW